MESAAWINDFLGWAWERHHDILSRYIRPLFVPPLAYFSYRHSLSGIALTLVAAGLIVCDAIVLYAAHGIRAGSSRRSGRAGKAYAHTRGNRT